MEKVEIITLLEEIMNDRGVPRNIKGSLEESICILKGCGPEEEKLAHVTSILDDASTDPNVSAHTRTRIWNVVSILEELNHREGAYPEVRL
ncbi:MAG: UPF0147 family protein [Candidatus Aenigmarchaeota archaeon]|nr:UPF0147 family protein [Candidatus Aenigmarchaeota archaeon]